MINKVITNSKTVVRRMKSKKGQTLVEFALILAFISLVAVSVMFELGNLNRPPELRSVEVLVSMR
jgi:competence protein ComGC